MSVLSSFPSGGGELTIPPVVFNGNVVGLEIRLRPGEGGQRRAMFGGIVKGALALRIVVISRLEAGDGSQAPNMHGPHHICGGGFLPPALRDIRGARHMHRISLHLKFSIKPGVCGRRRFPLSQFLTSDHESRGQRNLCARCSHLRFAVTGSPASCWNATAACLMGLMGGDTAVGAWSCGVIQEDDRGEAR